MSLLAPLLAALCLAAGVATMTTLTARTERYPSYWTWSFGLSAVALAVLLLNVDLPVLVDLWLAAAGLALTLFAVTLIRMARRVERRHGAV